MAEKELTDLENTRVLISKLMAETSRINNQNLFYPFVVAAALMGAGAALAKLFL